MGGNFTLYRIFYGDELVYLGRTTQALQDRIRAHLFKIPLIRELDIEKITKIEYSTFNTMADMYLYEVYFINLWHPKLNRDDKASDNLTISLPDVEWSIFTTHLWEKWKDEINKRNKEFEVQKAKEKELLEQKKEMREKLKNNKITKEEYEKFLDSFFDSSF